MAELQTYFYDLRFKSLLRNHIILIVGPDAVGFLKQTAKYQFPCTACEPAPAVFMVRCIMHGMSEW